MDEAGQEGLTEGQRLLRHLRGEGRVIDTARGPIRDDEYLPEQEEIARRVMTGKPSFIARVAENTAMGPLPSQAGQAEALQRNLAKIDALPKVTAADFTADLRKAEVGFELSAEKALQLLFVLSYDRHLLEVLKTADQLIVDFVGEVRRLGEPYAAR